MCCISENLYARWRRRRETMDVRRGLHAGWLPVRTRISERRWRGTSRNNIPGRASYTTEHDGQGWERPALRHPGREGPSICMLQHATIGCNLLGYTYTRTASGSVRLCMTDNGDARSSARRGRWWTAITATQISHVASQRRQTYGAQHSRNRSQAQMKSASATHAAARSCQNQSYSPCCS